EILWKMLKHYWLELEHYASMDILIKKTISILQRYGDDYSISFV
ncbi:MAG: IS630 family transposase, partial [Aureispira sp.]|nr:IS630 family transposase [Aureispira sp.]